MEESETANTPRFQCKNCAFPADFVVQPELVNENRRYGALYPEQMPFYLCKSHELIWKS